MKDNKYVILCVDDDPEFLASMVSVLEAAGYLLETASTAEEGLNRYRSANPDLVILDLMMEDIDSGMVFVKKIKALGETTPIYLLSGVGNELHSEVDYSSLGLSGVLQKPIAPNELVTLIKERLTGSGNP